MLIWDVDVHFTEFQFLVLIFFYDFVYIQDWNIVIFIANLIVLRERKGYLNSENMYAKGECRKNYCIVHLVTVTIQCNCFLNV